MREWADLHGEVFFVTGPCLRAICRRLVRMECRCQPTINKAVFDLRPPGVEWIGFILPNGSGFQSICRYAVSIDSVEAFTGIDFFPVVTDLVEEEIEGYVSEEHQGIGDGGETNHAQLGFFWEN